MEFGPDFGRLQRGEVVNGVQPDQVMGETRRGRKVVLTGDTAPCDMTRLVAWEADLLVHEATFMEDEIERAAETRHSTAAQAAELAAAAGVQMLALTHISPRYSGGEVRDEARAARFDNVIVPRDFDRVEIPFPERGEPVHIRASDRPPQPVRRWPLVETPVRDPLPRGLHHVMHNARSGAGHAGALVSPSAGRRGAPAAAGRSPRGPGAPAPRARGPSARRRRAGR